MSITTKKRTPKQNAFAKEVAKRAKRTAPQDWTLMSNVLSGVFWLMLALLWVFVVVSLLTFDVADPAWSHSTSNKITVRNQGGMAGAYFADIAYLIGGVSICWLAVAGAFWLYLYFQNLTNKKEQYYYSWIGFIGALLTLFSSATIEYALKSGTWTNLPNNAGGMIGSSLYPMLNMMFGLSGTVILAILLFLAGLSLLFQVSWLTLIEKLGAYMEGLWALVFKKPKELMQTPRHSRRMIKMQAKAEQQEVPDAVLRSGRHQMQVKVQPATEPLQNDLPFDEESSDISGSLKNALSTLLPSLDLLKNPEIQVAQVDPEQLQETAERIESKLKEYKIGVKVVSATAGPVVTRYEIEPAQGVKGSQIVNVNKDLARGLAQESVRVVETVSGRNTMAIELPNENRQMVYLGEMLRSSVFQNSVSPLTMALGKDIAGTPVVADLIKMPHLLVAGATGTGKSVGINAMIMSLLYKSTPNDVRLILVDPKITELSVYEGIPHLLCPVITDMKKVSNALAWCVNEMERRNRLLGSLSVRNIAGFNEKILVAQKEEKTIPNPFSLTPDNPEPLETLPRIVVIIDEMADLMMVIGKQVEQQIARLAQKARAAGIHLILATQRPSVDVITGLIKANVPTRIAFRVASKIDSRTILDQMGAEQLLGNGDMLFLPPGKGLPTRLHGAFVSDEEVVEVVGFLKRNSVPQYIDAITEDAEDAENTLSGSLKKVHSEDAMFDRAVAFVLETRKTSISSLQRHLRIGYNRAANLVEEMEKAGILSAPEINGTRKIMNEEN